MYSMIDSTDQVRKHQGVCSVPGVAVSHPQGSGSRCLKNMQNKKNQAQLPFATKIFRNLTFTHFSSFLTINITLIESQRITLDHS
jgi:hypothetical protein